MHDSLARKEQDLPARVLQDNGQFPCISTRLEQGSLDVLRAQSCKTVLGGYVSHKLGGPINSLVYGYSQSM